MIPALVLGMALLLAAPARADDLLDGFEDPTAWSATAGPGTSVDLAQDAGRTGSALRLDFDFHGGRGFVIARKAFPMTLPPNYVFRFWVRGQALPNTLEFKLVDPDGNVWWATRLDFAFPGEWRQIAVRKSSLRFAWGPAEDGLPERVAFIELAVSTGSGGKGSVWFDGLTFEPRTLDGPDDLVPKVSASTALVGREPELTADGDPQTSWHSGSVAENQWLLLDLGQPREYGALVIDWDAEDFATAYAVQVSDDGRDWRLVFSSTTSDGGRDYVYLPDTESRYVQLELAQSSRRQGYAIREITVKPIAFTASLNRFFKAIAADAAPGTFPKYLLGRQSYWTVVGADGDDAEALLNEEGMLEVDTHQFSIEPFLYLNGALVTWNDVELEQSLERDYLPIPSVTWRRDGLGLRVTAFAAGDPGASTLYATYAVTNGGAAHQDVVLFLALRPFQVLPPWQSLNVIGGVTPIHSLDFQPRMAWVNAEKAVVPLTPPDGFGAATFDQGMVANFLARGHLPLMPQVSDPFGYAEGAFEYHLSLDPGAVAEVRLAVPFHDPRLAMEHLLSTSAGDVQALHAATADAWERRLGRVDFTLPAEATKLVDSLRTTLAYILVNRDGPALQPGSRTYARAWIRDGAFTSQALLQLGFTAEVRDFIAWFARYQLPDGRIPCCVDRRGADTVPEHDSNGEFIWAVAEYYRFTRDVGFVYSVWPAVVKAVDSIASLRAARTTDAYREGADDAYFGLLPESISHEGYAAHPVHSYWDDFLALRGLSDAATLAAVVGEPERAAEITALRDGLRADLYGSIAKTMERHGIDYLPASADLGDLDPNSTAVAVSPGGELPYLPAAALARTFDLFYENLERRLGDDWPGAAFTPYEVRNAGLFVRLGDRERAWTVLQAMLDYQRPPAWNEWQEVVWRDATAPRFIGDMPHTWVGSGFIRSVRTMFAYERDEDGALVLGAGLPADWLGDGTGVGVTRLPTYYGTLGYRLDSAGPDALRMTLSGDLSMPPGGIVLVPPLPRPLRAVTVNGAARDGFAPDRVTITEFPADVVLEY